MPSLSAENNVGILIKAEADTGAISATTAELDKMGAAADKTAASTGKSFDSVTKSLGSFGKQTEQIGKSLDMYVSAPMVGVAYEAVKMGMTFQQTMEMLHTNAGTAQKDIAGLSDAVMKLAPQVGASPEALATAFYHIASAGNGIWNTAKQLDILKISAEGAAIGQANLDDTTYALTSTMASNVKGAQDASQTMSTLVAIVGAGDMKMQSLNAAIGTGFLGTAANFGISLSSVGAALATLTDNGESADAAATRLRMTWALMTSPSKAAAKLMTDLGLSSQDAAAAADQMNVVFSKTGLTTTKLATDLQQPNGINVALKDIQTQMIKAGFNAAETDSIMAKMFGGGRTDSALLTMLQNLDRTDEKFKIINASAGQFSEKWAEQQKLAKQQFNEAWAGIQDALIKLGTAIMPTVTEAFKKIGQAVGDVSKWFEGLSPGMKSFALGMGAVLIAAGPVLTIIGGLAMAISAIASPVGLVILAIIALAGAFVYVRTHTSELHKEFDALWKRVSQWTVVVILVQYFQQVMLPALKAIWNTIKNDLWPTLEQLWKSFQRLYEALEPALTTSLKVIGVIIGGILLLAIWAVLGVINLLTAALGYVAAAISNVINWISNVIGWFGNLVGVVVNTIKTIIAIFSNLIPAAWDVIRSIASIFGQLGGMILNAIGDLGNLLYDSGKRIIHGMANGIKDAMNDIKGAVSGGIDTVLHIAHIPGFATGTNYAPGGWSMVGENGPEAMYVPQGAQIKTNNQSSHMTTNNSSKTQIGTINIQTQHIDDSFFKKLDQDTLLTGFGMTPNRGMR